MTFEEKILLLASTPPGPEKQALLNKFTTGDIQFTSRYFLDAMPLDKYMEVNKERFRPVAEKAAEIRKDISNHGWTKDKTQIYLGEFPEPLEHERPEFSKSLPKKVRDENIRQFFKKYPAFRVDK